MTTRMAAFLCLAGLLVTVRMAQVIARLAAHDAELFARLRTHVEHHREVSLRAVDHVGYRRVLAGIRVPVALRLAVMTAVGERARATRWAVVQRGDAVRD